MADQARQIRTYEMAGSFWVTDNVERKTPFAVRFDHQSDAEAFAKRCEFQPAYWRMWCKGA